MIDVSADTDLTVNTDRFPSPWRMFFSKLFPFMKKIKTPTILDVLVQTTILSSIGKTKELKNTNFYLHLPLERFNLLEFDALEDIVQIGYAHTMKKMEQWKHQIKWKKNDIN